MSVNKAILIGNLGADPDLSTTKNGKQMAKIRLATTEKFKRTNGEKDEETQWHHVTFFDKTAEVVGQYLKKGDKIYVEGKIRNSVVEGEDGQKKYFSEVVAFNMQMLGGKNGQGNGQTQTQFQEVPPQKKNQETKAQEIEKFTPPLNTNSVIDDTEDDLPF